MSPAVASCAETNQIHFVIIPLLAALDQVMHLQLGPAAAALTAPVVTPQHLLDQFLVSGRGESYTSAFRRQVIHVQ